MTPLDHARRVLRTPATDDAIIAAAKRTAYPLAFVDAPRKGLIRSQLPACAGFVGFALAVILGRV